MSKEELTNVLIPKNIKGIAKSKAASKHITLREYIVQAITEKAGIEKEGIVKNNG